MMQNCKAAAVMATTAALGLAMQAHAQNANRNDPVPATPFQSLTAIERGFAVIPTAEPLTLFPQIREQLKDTPAFLRDSKAGINIRSYYRDNVSNASRRSSSTVSGMARSRRSTTSSPCAANIGRSSRSFPALRVASKSVRVSVRATRPAPHQVAEAQRRQG